MHDGENDRGAGHRSLLRAPLTMKIAYLVDGLRAGGKERQSVELVKGLACQDQVSVMLVCMGQDTFFEPLLAETPIRVERLLRRRRWDPGIFPRLYRLIKSFEADVLHTTCWMTSFYGLPVARTLRAQLVNGSIRNAFGTRSLRWRIERLLLGLSDARVANSEAGLRSRGFGPGQDGNHVVYNGFDFARTEKLDQTIKEKLLNLAHGRKLVGMVAQFKDDKDYGTYFTAARRLLDRRKDVAFVAVGDGKNLADHTR